MPEAKKCARNPQAAKSANPMRHGYEAQAQNQLDGLRIAAVENPKTGKDSPIVDRVSIVEKLIGFLQAME